MKNLIFIFLCLSPIILSSLTSEIEKIDEFAASGDFGQFHRLIIDDDYLYAISIYGFEINEVDDQGSLTRISLIPLEGKVDGIEKIGSNIFVSVSTYGTYQTEIHSSLYKVDVSNPYEPIIVNSITFPDNIKNYVLRKSGEYISYHKLEEIGGHWFFTEIIFMDPITFEEVTSYEIHTFTDHLKENYFLQQRNPGEYDFDVYDYSDIYNIQLVSSVDFSSCPTEFMKGYAINDDNFVLLGNDSISIYDISDLSDIHIVSTYYRHNNSSPFGDCLQVDNYILIPSQSAGIEVVDITNLENPTLFDFWEYPYEEISPMRRYFDTTGGLIYENGHIYVGTFYDGILQMNYTNGSIEYVDNFLDDRINFGKHEILDNKLISTGCSGGLYVYDIEYILSPTLDMIIFEDLIVNSFEIVNETIFISTISLSNEEYYLKAYNISDLSNPILKLDQELIGGGLIFILNEDESDFIYVCSNSGIQLGEIAKFSISSTGEVEQVLSYSFQEVVLPSFFFEGYLYLEEWDEDGVKDLLIYDGFEDENPQQLIDLPNFVGNSRLHKVNEYLNLSQFSYTDGDYFYNLDDPLNPELAFTTPISSKWSGCKIRDNVLFCPSAYTVYLYDIEGNPSGELETFDYFNLNSRYYDINFISQGEDDYFFCEQRECISTYNYTIETSAEDELPKPEIMLSNYPNPFNPETNIVFNLPEDGDVQLDMYNIKGQKVDHLEITNYELGINEVTWDAKRFASGIYMYQLTVDGKAIASKKCLFLK